MAIFWLKSAIFSQFSSKMGYFWLFLSYFQVKSAIFEWFWAIFSSFSLNFHKGVVQDLIWFSLIFSQFSGKYCFKFNLISFQFQLCFNLISIWCILVMIWCWKNSININILSQLLGYRSWFGDYLALIWFKFNFNQYWL